jgi:hypothetical protein
MLVISLINFGIDQGGCGCAPRESEQNCQSGLGIFLALHAQYDAIPICPDRIVTAIEIVVLLFVVRLT